MQNKKGYTFIEVVIVVWILITIATIVVLSFISYIWSAKNTKRISDLNNIQKSIDIWQTKWRNYNSYVYGSSSTITGSNIKIWWYNNYDDISKYYKAGDINYDNLWFKKQDFLDPEMQKSYKMWSIYNNKYELAATISKDWEYDSYIIWNRKPRSKEQTKCKINKIQWNIVYLWNCINYFIVWDIVTIWGEDYIIKGSINKDITLNKDVSMYWENIYLKNSESEHIIKSWWTNEAIKENQNYKYTPYYY